MLVSRLVEHEASRLYCLPPSTACTACTASCIHKCSGCLALLINLVEHKASWRQHLRQMQLPDTSGGASGARLQVVPLLCTLLAAVAPRSKAAAATPTGEGLGE